MSPRNDLAADYQQHAPDPPSNSFLCGLALFAAEVVHCGRPVATLSSSITPAVSQQLQLQQRIVLGTAAQRNTKREPITWVRQRPLIHTFRTADNCLDCVATLVKQRRAFAVAIRLKYAHGKWRAEEITVL